MRRGHQYGGGGQGRRHGGHCTPTPAELVERLQHRRERLQQELANVDELINRLGTGEATAPAEPAGV